MTTPDQIKVTRSIVHRGRIAPKGHIFFIANSISKGRKCTLAQLYKTAGFTDEIENKIIADIKKDTIEHFKLNGKE